MKILFFATYPTAPIGYARVANIITNYLAEQGHNLYYLGISNFPNNQINRFVHPSIHLIDGLNEERKLGNDELYGVNVICNFLDELKPDLLFLYNDVVVISRIFNKFIERKIIKQYKILTYLDLVYDFEKIDLIRHINLFSDHIMVFSKCWKNNIIEMGVDENKITILHHGLDINKFYHIDKIHAKQIFGFNCDDFVVLNTNRNNYRKAIDVTIDAFVIFLKSKNLNPKIKLFLNMNTNCNSDQTGYDIINLIKISCLVHKVDYNVVANNNIFMSNTHCNISDEMLNNLYNACDIGMNTCVGEGFGLCNLEHGGLGKPQIISGVGALNDIFSSDYSIIIKPVAKIYLSNSTDFHGGFIEICKSEDFAHALDKYYSDEKLCSAHGSLCEDYLKYKYNWNNILIKLSDLILKL